MAELSEISLTLVGAGKMGGAMLLGWLNQGLGADKTSVIEPNAGEEIAGLASEWGFSLVGNPGEAKPSDFLVVAVKPQMMETVLPGLACLVGPQTIVVSVAAGTPIDIFRQYLGAETLVVRAMPNTPAQVGRGMTAAVASDGIDRIRKDIVASLLSSMGSFVWVEREEQIDAVTAVSGSGPAYVFHMVEALAKAGEEVGLDPEVAGVLARQTITGAGELLHRSDLAADQLRENVTSPGGTTAAALAVLMDEQEGLPHLMMRAVKAARDRSVELAQEK